MSTKASHSDDVGFQLTDQGRRLGAELVRSHRLLGTVLVTEGGVSVDRIHGQAEKLEHFTGRDFGMSSTGNLRPSIRPPRPPHSPEK